MRPTRSSGSAPTRPTAPGDHRKLTRDDVAFGAVSAASGHGPEKFIGVNGPDTRRLPWALASGIGERIRRFRVPTPRR